MKPDLSVIIPIYNKAPFLQRCLDSCVKQKGNVEFILVNDGSTDASGEFCDAYAKLPNFRAFHKKNGGVSSARNFGIDKAKGKYLAFLDADDEYVENAVEAMLTYKQGDISSFNHFRQIGTRPPRLKRYVGTGIYDAYKRQTCWWAVWNKIYKTSFIKDNNIRFDEQVTFGEDELFNIECLLGGKTYYHFAIALLIRHFDDKESLVHKLGPKGVLEQYDGLTRIEERLKKEGAKQQDINIPKSLKDEHVKEAHYLRILEGRTPEEYRKWKHLT